MVRFEQSTTRGGALIRDAHFRIMSVAISRNADLQHMAVIKLHAYEGAPAGQASVIERRYFAAVAEIDAMRGRTFLAKCYRWVSKQPDMAGGASDEPGLLARVASIFKKRGG